MFLIHVKYPTVQSRGAPTVTHTMARTLWKEGHDEMVFVCSRVSDAESSLLSSCQDAGSVPDVHTQS